MNVFNTKVSYSCIDLSSPSSAEDTTNLKWNSNARKLLNKNGEPIGLKLRDLVDSVHKQLQNRLIQGPLDEAAQRTLAPAYLKLVSLQAERDENEQQYQIQKNWSWYKDANACMIQKLESIAQQIDPEMLNAYSQRIDILNSIRNEVAIHGPYSQIILQLSKKDLSLLPCLSKEYQTKFKEIDLQMNIGFRKLNVLKSSLNLRGTKNYQNYADGALKILPGVVEEAYRQAIVARSDKWIEKILDDQLLFIYLANDPCSLWDMFLLFASPQQVARLAAENHKSFLKFFESFKTAEAKTAIRHKIQAVCDALEGDSLISKELINNFQKIFPSWFGLGSSIS